MNKQDELEQRLRDMHRNLDAGTGFEARVAEARRAIGTPRADLREQFERRRVMEVRKLRREAWMSGIAASALVIATGGLLWRLLPEVLRYAEANAVTLGSAPALVVALVLAISVAVGALKATHTRIVLR